MSDIEQLTEQYLQTRRALGYSLRRPGYHLPKLARRVRQCGQEYLTIKTALEWAVDTPSGTPYQTAVRLSWARLLAKFLSVYDPRTEIPSPDLAIPVKSTRPTPYIYKDDEVLALMQACGRFHGLKVYSYASLIGLLAVTGLRIGEAIKLDRNDIDPRRQTLTVRDGKFGKTRQVLLSLDTCEAIYRYGRRRDKAVVMAKSNALFLANNGKRLIYSNVHYGFHRLVDDIGLAAHTPRPRPHDLRHTFAVETLRRWYAEGCEIEPRLPRLSTWLGHASPSSTYWYLSATPELLELARARAERHHAVQCHATVPGR